LKIHPASSNHPKYYISCMIRIILFAVFLSASAFVLFADGLVTIPAGVFNRGSADGEVDERPVRSIQMSSFGMMARPVTEAQYQKCVDAGKCSPARYNDGGCMVWAGRGFQKVVVPKELRGDNLPVACVTWQQARAYCASVGMRLPTEAQWEYAALGGAAARYSWGNAQPDRSRCALSKLHPVGSFAPNRYGLYDMTGNVWEWTSDFYAADHYITSEDVNPRGPVAGYYRVIRGGGFYSGPNELRVQNRHWFAPQSAEVSVGFRCVR
jgi:formylglycine-generating enzyme required for sulfatase activity